MARTEAPPSKSRRRSGASAVRVRRRLAELRRHQRRESQQLAPVEHLQDVPYRVGSLAIAQPAQRVHRRERCAEPLSRTSFGASTRSSSRREPRIIPAISSRSSTILSVMRESVGPDRPRSAPPVSLSSSCPVRPTGFAPAAVDSGRSRCRRDHPGRPRAAPAVRGRDRRRPAAAAGRGPPRADGPLGRRR